MTQERKRLFSGVQPTGDLHLGNYVGALSLWRELQETHDCLFCVVDLHALTVPESIDPGRLRAKTREVAALLVACGIDPEKSAIFVQSRVPEHAELAWILGCVTPLGWLERMTQFKSKSRQVRAAGTGLLTYPALQAADILLYGTRVVPVGEDQKQHVELARDVAARFNGLFGETFILPEALVREEGARIMALDDPESKMSKSAGAARAGSAIGLLDPPARIRRAIQRAVTDPGHEVRFETSSAGVKNLLVIYRSVTGLTREAIEGEFSGKGYGVLKSRVAEAVVSLLDPIQRRWREIAEHPDVLEATLARGAETASGIARATMRAVRVRTGIG